MRLDELEARLSGAARDSIADEVELQSALSAIHSDIQELKDHAERLRKSGWFKVSSLKVLRWSADPHNRALLKNGFDVAKSLLLTSGTDTPPSDGAI